MTHIGQILTPHKADIGYSCGVKIYSTERQTKVYIRARRYHRVGMTKVKRFGMTGEVIYFEAVESYREDGKVKKRVFARWKNATTLAEAIAQAEASMNETRQIAARFRVPVHQPSITREQKLIEKLKAVQEKLPNWAFTGKTPEIKRKVPPSCPDSAHCYFARGCDFVTCAAMISCS